MHPVPGGFPWVYDDDARALWCQKRAAEFIVCNSRPFPQGFLLPAPRSEINQTLAKVVPLRSLTASSTDSLKTITADAQGSAMKQHARVLHACFLCLWCSFLAPGKPA